MSTPPLPEPANRTVQRARYRVSCQECEATRDFYVETNRRDWTYAHERISKHGEFALTAVSADLSEDDYVPLMQP